MKSLQLLTPAIPCIFNCPFCIAGGHVHQNQFFNAYRKQHDDWVARLTKVIKTASDLKTVVITGTNEPLQSPDCVQEMIEIVHAVRPDVQIELQTRYYKPLSVMTQCDVVAYSIADPVFLDKVKPNGRVNRYVILLTDAFEVMSLDDIIAKLPDRVSQLTFKRLQDSHGVNQRMDQWILDHGMKLHNVKVLEREVQEYQGNLSIFFDENCMNALDRYMVFREDGNLYADYDTKEVVDQ